MQQDTPLLRRFLELLGIGTDRLVDLSKVRHVLCENLFACSYQSGPGHYHPEYISWLRTRGLTRPRNGETKTPRKIIFLSRQHADSRRLVNENQVIEAFGTESIQLVSLEKHSLDQQLDFFLKAEGVVAPHGAGLSHLIWAQPNLPVLELFPSDFFNACYWELASVVGALYGCAAGESTKKGNVSNRDFFVPPKLVCEVFAQIKRVSDLF